jgi:hypothetical protein
MFLTTTGDQRFDATRPEQPAVLIVVIATIGENDVGFLAWPADFARDRTGGQIVQQRDQLGDVITVPARQRDGERNPAGVNEEMVF